MFMFHFREQRILFFHINICIALPDRKLLFKLDGKQAGISSHKIMWVKSDSKITLNFNHAYCVIGFR